MSGLYNFDHRSSGNIPLLRFLNFPWTPGLIEERQQGTVEAQKDKPSFAGCGLDPVARLSFRSLGAEVDCGGTIDISNCRRRRKTLASGARKTLRSIQHGTSLV